MRVLLVSQRGTALQWGDGPAGEIQWTHARTLDAAADLLRADHVDAVLFESDLLRDVGRNRQLRQGLSELREQARGTAFVIMDDDGFESAPSLTPFIDATIPPRAAPDVQAQLVALAAERATLHAALEQRTRELSASRARFRDVIERNADAIIVVGRDGMIRFANSMAEELFRDARGELCGTHFGYPVVAGETTELDIVRAGSLRVVEMRVVETEWEGADACIASLRDITERKRAEEDARRLIREQAAREEAELSARRSRLLAEVSAVLAGSLDYRTTLAALARLCAASIADWAAVFMCDDDGNVHRLEVAHRDPALAGVVKQLTDTAMPVHAEHTVSTVIATRTPLLMSTLDDATLRDVTGDVNKAELAQRLGVSSFMIVPLIARERCLGALSLVSARPDRTYDAQDLALAQDIAWRAALSVDNARLYQQAFEANRAKTELLAVISHDLRTPLNAIIGHADLLSLGVPDPLTAGNSEHVDKIRTSTRHLLYLIDELLSFARLEAGRTQVHWQAVDARALAHDVAAVIGQLAEERNLRFTLDAGDVPIELHTDPDKLRQIMLNLAANAVNYTPDGEVQLAVHAADGKVTLEVRDTGIGIRDIDLPHIFEPFWQAAEGRRARNGGTGLGLSVVQRLVRLLGGAITVRSEPGKGSTFSVLLPREPDAELLSASAAPPAPMT